MRFTAVLLVLMILLLGSCNKSLPIDNANSAGTWLIPTKDIINFGTETDRIISIDKPYFIEVSESKLKDDAVVYAIRQVGILKIYPLTVLATHEIVNDRIGNNLSST